MSETERQRGFREGIAHARRCMREGMPGFRCDACKSTTAETERLRRECDRMRRESARDRDALRRVRSAVKEPA